MENNDNHYHAQFLIQNGVLNKNGDIFAPGCFTLEPTIRNGIIEEVSIMPDKQSDKVLASMSCESHERAVTVHQKLVDGLEYAVEVLTWCSKHKWGDEENMALDEIKKILEENR